MAVGSNVEALSPRSESVFGVTIAFFACATVFIAFRMLSRVWIVRRVSLDDYFIVVAWVIAFGLSFSICYGASVGLGRHEVDVPSFWHRPLGKAQYAFSVLYQPALMAEKTSILVFYLTLAKANRVFKWATIATLVVVNVAGLILTLVTIFECHPVAAAFDYPTPSTARCTDIVTIYLSSAPVNIITDLAMLFLPMPLLTGMRLPKKQKIILVITFGAGFFLIVVDIIRVAYLQSASEYRLSELASDKGSSQSDTNMTDFSWYASISFMWSAIEVNLGIICACVPALKPLVSRFMPHFIHEKGFKTGRFPSDHTARMYVAGRVPSVPPAQLSAHSFSAASMRFRETESRDFSPAGISHSGSEANEGPLGMMDFLTEPGMNKEEVRNRLQKSQTALTKSTRDTRSGTPAFFGFVNMGAKRSMVHMSNRESGFPVAMVTILFFIWGFEYGLLDTLNQQFQIVAHVSAGQDVALHSAYFAGYLVGPWAFGRLVLKYWGFKACYSVGLAIYACGTLVFWVAAVLTSFPTYVVVNFIVGIGLSILETGANPFIALTGPQEYAEIRLNLSQGFQAIGTIVAPLIAAKAFTKYTSDAPSLINTQWAYLGIALFTVALAIVYYYIPLPEATDEELEDASERMDDTHRARIGKTDVIWVLLAFGVLSQFCYVGGQEVLSTTFESYLNTVMPSLDTTNFFAIAHTAFAASRFLAAGLGFFIKPRILLLAFYMGAIIFSALAMNFTSGTATALAILVFFFEGPIFSLIYAQCLRGMGKHTKTAAVAITSSTSGGAVFPVFAYLALNSRGPQYSLCVAVAAFVGGTLLPILLSAEPKTRRIVDPIEHCGRKGSSTGSLGSVGSTMGSLLKLQCLPGSRKRSKDDGLGTTWKDKTGPDDDSAPKE